MLELARDRHQQTTIYLEIEVQRDVNRPQRAERASNDNSEAPESGSGNKEVKAIVQKEQVNCRHENVAFRRAPDDRAPFWWGWIRAAAATAATGSQNSVGNCRRQAQYEYINNEQTCFLSAGCVKAVTNASWFHNLATPGQNPGVA